MAGLKALFLWYGGKSHGADLIWSMLGDPKVYAEPFAGSLAVLLKRAPSAHHRPREMVVDIDHHIVNFWREVKADPEAVAHHCDHPTFHADLTARHRWLREWGEPHRKRVMDDPEYFDARAVGWWVWCVSLWIGGGWCQVSYDRRPMVQATGGGRGVSARPSAPDALAASGCRPCRAPVVVHRAARPRHRRQPGHARQLPPVPQVPVEQLGPRQRRVVRADAPRPARHRRVAGVRRDNRRSGSGRRIRRPVPGRPERRRLLRLHRLQLGDDRLQAVEDAPEPLTPARQASPLLLRDRRHPHRRHRVPVAAGPGRRRPHHLTRVDPIRLRLLPPAHDLQAGRVADHHLQILALEPARQPETLVARPVDRHHADVPAGSRGPLPRPHRPRQEPVHLRSGSSPYRPVRDASAGSPTARIQPVPLTCSAAYTVVKPSPEGEAESFIPFSSHSASGAAFRPPCHHMLKPSHSPAPNRPQRQTRAPSWHLSEDGAPRRIRLEAIGDYGSGALHGFIAASVAPGARVVTDGWSGHPGLPENPRGERVVGGRRAHEVLTWVHRVFSSPRRWAMGVYHGLRRRHVQRYLDGSVFRWNRRRHRRTSPGSLPGIGLGLPPATYHDIVGGRA